MGCRGRMRRSSVGGLLSLSVRAARSRVVAAEIGVSEATVYRWRAQDRIDRGERPGLSSVERSSWRRRGGGSASWRRSWRSRRRRQRCSPTARCAQKEVPGDRLPGRAGLRDQTLLPDPWRRTVGVLRLAAAVTDARRAAAGVAARADQPDPRRLARACTAIGGCGRSCGSAGRSSSHESSCTS